MLNFLAEANCIEVLELGSLPRLVKLLSSAEKVIRSYTVICLAAMVTNGIKIGNNIIIIAHFVLISL